MALLEVKDLTCSYPNRSRVLDRITLAIQEGPFISILGPNGAGKSTLLKILGGILRPDEGTVEIEGIRIQWNRDVSFLLSYVPQSLHIPMEMRVIDFVLLGRPHALHLSGRVRALDVEKAFYALEQVGCGRLWKENVIELSGGEQQKILIAKALAQETKVLLIDEPVTHLDLRNQIEVLTLLRTLAKEKDRRVIAVMHDVNQAREFTDYAVFLRGGKICAAGASQEVISKETVQTVFGIKVEERMGIFVSN
ncbi:MAG: ABC transporter ATP-binding protein [Spirochaetes bacterium]|nr:ABC transporter ATP-binding protein [Spirochaetota bacterium]